MTERRWRRN